MTSQKISYNKPPLTSCQHLAQLKNRSLTVNDDDKSIQYLDTIGYYRLSAYFIPFEQTSNGDMIRNHNFNDNTTFDDILNLYIFDRKLRLIVMEAVERIEVAIRTKWANALANLTNDAHAFMRVENFRDPWTHQKKLAKVTNNLNESGEVFVKHYKEKYEQPFLPPIWAMVETLTLGELSKWFTNTANDTIKKEIAKSVGFPSVEILQSVMQGISLMRNICAHHGRLWNRRLVKPLPYIKKLRETIQTEDASNQPRKELFNYLVVTSQMMRAIQPNSTWQTRLQAHIATASTNHQRAMGFPENWQQLAFFQQEKA